MRDEGRKIALAAAITALCGSSQCLAGTFTYTVLGSPYPNMTVTGVNSRNQVVGFYYNDAAPAVDLGFSWSNGQYASVTNGWFNGPLNASGAAACVGCSSKRDVADTYNINSAKLVGYRVTGLPKHIRPFITGINDAGTVAGLGFGRAITQPFFATKKGAVLLSPPFDGGGNNAGYNNLDLQINESGTVAAIGYGYYKGVDGNWLFTYSGGSYTMSKTPAASGDFPYVTVVASDGTIGGAGSQPFTFRNGTFTLYGSAACQSSEIVGIGPDDEVAGEACQSAGGALQAFIAMNGTAQPYEYPGAATGNTIIYSMASNGTIVGQSKIGNGAPFLFIGICPADQEPCTQ